MPLRTHIFFNVEQIWMLSGKAEGSVAGGCLSPTRSHSWCGLGKALLSRGHQVVPWRTRTQAQTHGSPTFHLLTIKSSL